MTVNQLGAMFTLYFTDQAVTDFASAKTSDSAAYATFFQQMRARGVWLAPSGYECAMISFAHTDEDFAAVVAAAREVRF